jgi:hypothetical protein
MMLKHVFGQHTGWAQVIQEVNEKEFKKTGKGIYPNVTQVDELPPEEISPKKFLNYYMKQSRPVLIKGLAK